MSDCELLNRLTPKQREYVRLYYLGGVEAIPSEPGRCSVVNSLCDRGIMGRDGITRLGKSLGAMIVDANHFTLANDPPSPRRAPAVVNEPERQRVLIDGLGCLPGQLDLF